MIPRIEVIGVTGIPEIKPGDQLGEIITSAAKNQGTPLEGGDVLVVTQKIVSKAEGMVIDLATVEPSVFAHYWASACDKDPRLIELVLRESRSIVRMDMSRGILITETKHGFVCANSGIDTSNVPGEDMVALLPVDSDESARRIGKEILQGDSRAVVAVIISDTFGRAWREGHANFAIGVSGMNPIKDYKGTPDAYGQILKVTAIAIADELASTAELATAKSIGVPVTIIRGYEYAQEPDGVQSLIREKSKDLFR